MGDLRQRRLHLGHGGVLILGQSLHKRDVRQPLDAVLERGVRDDGRVGVSLGVLQPAGRHRGALGRRAARQQESQAFLRPAPLGARRDVRHEFEHLPNVAVQGLARKRDHHASGPYAVQRQNGADPHADATSLEFLPLRERLVIIPRGAHLGEKLRKEVQVRHQSIGKVRDVHHRADVRDAVRGLLVELQRHAGLRRQLLRTPSLDFAGHRFRDDKGGQHGGVLHRVLARAQRHGLANDFLLPRFVEPRAEPRDA
mmetsp:Transcript_25856/g.64581  ORF Transcript_25856/g.64581 Transcript_25856/m.64581 type:complete len:255 (+) Transcript_25856:583-1347(+)